MTKQMRDLVLFITMLSAIGAAMFSGLYVLYSRQMFIKHCMGFAMGDETSCKDYYDRTDGL